MMEIDGDDKRIIDSPEKSDEDTGCTSNYSAESEDQSESEKNASSLDDDE